MEFLKRTLILLSYYVIIVCELEPLNPIRLHRLFHPSYILISVGFLVVISGKILVSDTKSIHGYCETSC